MAQALQSKLGFECRTSGRQLLNRLQRSRKYADELHTRIVRLTKAHVLLKAAVKDQTIGFSGTLCSAHWNDELPDFGLPATHVGRAGKYLITIDPAIAGLFGTSVYSLVHWDVRRELARSPLAQWLHAFFSTHRDPLPYSLDKLRELSGSENKTARSFRQKVRNAFEVIEEKSARYGELFQGEVGSDDLVRVRTKRAEGGRVRSFRLHASSLQ